MKIGEQVSAAGYVGARRTDGRPDSPSDGRKKSLLCKKRTIFKQDLICIALGSQSKLGIEKEILIVLHPAMGK